MLCHARTHMHMFTYPLISIVFIMIAGTNLFESIWWWRYQRGGSQTLEQYRFVHLFGRKCTRIARSGTIAQSMSECTHCLLQSQIGHSPRRFGRSRLSLQTISRPIPLPCQTRLLFEDPTIFTFHIETALFGQLSRMFVPGLSRTLSNLVGYWNGILSTFARIAHSTGLGRIQGTIDSSFER